MTIITAKEASSISLSSDGSERVDMLLDCMIYKVMFFITREAKLGNHELKIDYDKIVCMDEFKRIYEKELTSGMLDDSRHDIMDFCEENGILSGLEERLTELGYSVSVSKNSSKLRIPFIMDYEASYRVITISW